MANITTKPNTTQGRAHLAETAATTITLPQPAAELDRAARITYYHTLCREAGRASIMAAIAVGVP